MPNPLHDAGWHVFIFPLAIETTMAAGSPTSEAWAVGTLLQDALEEEEFQTCLKGASWPVELRKPFLRNCGQLKDWLKHRTPSGRQVTICYTVEFHNSWDFLSPQFEFNLLSNTLRLGSQSLFCWFWIKKFDLLVVLSQLKVQHFLSRAHSLNRIPMRSFLLCLQKVGCFYLGLNFICIGDCWIDRFRCMPLAKCQVVIFKALSELKMKPKNLAEELKP